MRLATYPIIATLLANPAVAQDRPLTADMTEVYRVGGVNAREWAFFGPAVQASFYPSPSSTKSLGPIRWATGSSLEGSGACWLKWRTICIGV